MKNPNRNATLLRKTSHLYHFNLEFSFEKCKFVAQKIIEKCNFCTPKSIEKCKFNGLKSGKDYTVHSALTRLIACSDYHIKEGVVLCNSREVRADGNITYMPIYYIMFFDTSSSSADIYF